MKNQTLNLKNLYSGMGFFLLFLVFSGSELRANSLSSSNKKYDDPNKIKWMRYDKSSIDKKMETARV